MRKLALCLLLLAACTPIPQLFGAPTPTPVPVLPIPISMSMPGGWVFGGLDSPLDCWPGTACGAASGQQVCTGFSLLGTIQLQAVVQALRPGDEIKLGMSNYDSLLYKVQAVEQVPSSEIAMRAKENFPCLLVILRTDGTDTLWVVTAKP